MEKVSVVNCSSYSPKEVRKAILESLGNIDFKLKKNMKVLIKPNLLFPAEPEKAITTHPVIIEELCRILKKSNAEIYIGESSGSETKRAFEVCGIKKLSKLAKIVNFESQDKVFFDLGYKRKVPLPKLLFGMDLVINVAKLKTHELTKVTLCVKNLYGCISGKLKSEYHKLLPREKMLSRFLSKLEKTIKPELNIIDGVVGMEGNGPGASGNIIESKILIAGKSAGAVDIISSEIMGFNPEAIWTNQFSGIKREAIEKVGSGKNIKLNFKKPDLASHSVLSLFYTILPSPKISFKKEKCKLCGLCEKKCPVNAIKISNMPKCRHTDCIKCLCCVEICPSGAVYLKDADIILLLRKIKKRLLKN